MGRSDRLPFYEPAQCRRAEARRQPAARRSAADLRIDGRGRSASSLSPVSPLEAKEAIYQQLVDARGQPRVVRIEYDSLTEWERITTKLRPYHLLFCRHSWYVIGRSSLHSEVRTFNLSRIVSHRVLNEKFSVPRSFSIERHLRNAWA